jgi:hypothetical protein
MKRIGIGLLCLFSVIASAKEHPTVTVHVVDSRVETSEVDGHVLMPDGSKATIEKQRGPLTIYVHVVMPDGSKATLWCEARSVLRACSDPEPGDYKAEVAGDVIWLYIDLPAEKVKYGSDGKLLPRKTRLEKVRYHIITANH